MESDSDSELAIELARHALTQVAPEELPLFPATSELYRENPRAIETEASSDEVLGFGVEIVMALAPAALSVGGAVVSFLLKQVGAAVSDESEGAIRDLVHRLFAFAGHDDEAHAAPPPLSPEQLRRVRDVALERARKLKLPKAQAELLADAMVGGLVSG